MRSRNFMMILIIAFAILFLQPTFAQMTTAQNYWNQCHQRTCRDRFNCKCRNDTNPAYGVLTNKQECIDQSWLCDGIPDCNDGEDEIDCICSDDEFQCNVCKREECDDGIPIFQCIPMGSVGDGKLRNIGGLLVSDCYNGNDELQQRCISCNGEIDCPSLTPNDEVNCTECPSNLRSRCDCNQEGNFTCEINLSIGGRKTCYSSDSKCDGIENCVDASDELHCSNFSCPENLFCDGYISCSWLIPNDEANCTECPTIWPNRCECNQERNFTCGFNSTTRRKYVCYPSSMECDGNLDCSDGSDEFGSCTEDEFQCDCFKKRKCNKCSGCIKKTLAEENGFIECPHIRIPFGSHGKINIHKLNNISECIEIGYPQCDNNTCYNFNYLTCIDNECVTSSYLTCTSFCFDKEYCKKKPAFQCADNNYIFLDHFCDGTVDCIDGSDEIVNKPGFKCNECVLPQNNLYDDLAHCDDQSDLCLFANNNSCFQCLDKRLLISSKQVCDGVNDCYDLSDECLCDNNVDAEICVSLFKAKNHSCSENKTLSYTQDFLKIDIYSIQSKKKTITCPTKFGFTQAIPCDGRPECKDYSDECQCNNPPTFCNDSCHFNFPMGDRYCDGVEDPAWVYFKNTSCPQGFDERSCPKRFKCNAAGNVNIDVLQVCDGISNCNDNSDEYNCSVENNEAIFSSDTEMIANPGLKFAFWVMGFIVLVGNAYVIINTATFLKEQRNLTFLGFQRVIILNISFADFIMGVYLIIIAAYSAVFTGIYGSVDREWRSSLKCSIIGSLSVTSSETSCFLMVVLTVFRLINICKPISSLSSSLFPWKLSLAATWLLSICFSVAPMLDVTSSYFVHSISFSSRFHQNGSIGVDKLKQFMCNYAVLSNTTVKDYGNHLQSIEMFLKTKLPESEPVRRFGYYGETSVCMPRFYVARGEPSWEFTLSLLTVNFLCFVFIAVSYVIIYRRSSQSSANIRSKRSDQQAATMQKRIARIIVTDFCCWIPICIMAYVRLGVDFSNIVYQISAALLLPINSALNPFLFSSLPDKMIDLCSSKLLKLCKSSW